MANRKIQGEITLDSTQAEESIARVETSTKRMAQTASQEGKKAEEAIASIGDGGGEAAQKIDRATTNIIASIKRATADRERFLAGSDAGGKGTSKYFESLANQRGIDTAPLQPFINKLAEVESALSVATAAENRFAEGQEFQKKLQQAAELNRASEYVRWWNEALIESEAAEKRFAEGQSFVQGLQSQAAAIGKTRAELLELKAAELGVTDQAAPFIAKMKAAEASMMTAGGNAKQLAWAMRLVPAQMTDIVTSLQMGMNPMTVLIQQGGQLRDMFGSAGAAARAMGGYIVSLLRPLNVAIAVAGGFAYAFYAGRKESEELTKAIILSGNAAGTSKDQLIGMAGAVANLTGATKGAAVEALGQLVTSGQVTAGQLQLVGEAAINMERYAGKAVADTAKEFAELGKSPVDAIYRLNQQYRFLTPEIYAQVKALDEQGRKTEAIALAQKTYAEATKNMAVDLKENLGFVEKAWLGIKDAAKGAWDTILAVGREQTIDERIAELEQLAAPGRGIFSGRSAAQDEELSRLKAKKKQDEEGAKAKAESNRQEAAGIEWIKESNKYLSQRQQIELETQRIRNQGREAGIPEAEIQRRIAKMREGYDQGIAQAISQGEIAFAKAAAQRYGEYYTNELERFRLSTVDFANAMAALERQALEREQAAIRRQRPSDDAGRIQQAQRLKELSIEIDQVEARRLMRIEDGNAKIQKQLDELAVAAGKLTDPMETAGIEFGKRFGETLQRAMAEGGSTAERAAAMARQAWIGIATGVDFSKTAKEFDTTISGMETRLADLELSFASGRISAAEKAVGEKAIRNQIASDLDGIYSKLKAIAETSNDPEAASRLAEYAHKLSGIKLQSAKTLTEFDEFARSAARNIQSSLADFLFDPFSKGVDNMAVQFGKAIQRMIAEAVAADLSRRLFGNLGSTGQVGGWAGDLMKFFGLGSGGFSGGGVSQIGNSPMAYVDGSLMELPFAKGGAFDNVPSLSAYSGHIVNVPTIFPFARGAGLMGEAGPEAILPLKRGPDGKLGVSSDSGGNFTINIHMPAGTPAETRRAAGAGAREALQAFNRAQRYS